MGEIIRDLIIVGVVLYLLSGLVICVLAHIPYFH